MYILELIQEDESVELGLFEKVEEGRKFISKLEAYEKVVEDGILYEYIIPSKLPKYIEIEVNGNIVPFTKYMFPNDTKVEIIWKEIPNLAIKGKGIVESATRVDAYSINNEEVKEYITKREENFKNAKDYLEEKGYDVTMSYFGSEDGEAILYKKKEEDDWHFLTHMDPCFVEEENIRKMIEDIFNENE